MESPTWKQCAIMLVASLLAGALLAGTGALMLHPAHSEQARPLLTARPAPDCPAAAPADEDTALPLRSYRDRGPASLPPAKPLPAYVVVNEGDGDRMRDIIRCDARSHGAAAFAVAAAYGKGYIIHYDERWERRLADLNPWLDPAATGKDVARSRWTEWRLRAFDAPTPGYRAWAAGAATAGADAAVATPLPQRVRLIVVEDVAGSLSDQIVRELGRFTIIVAVALVAALNGIMLLARLLSRLKNRVR